MELIEVRTSFVSLAYEIMQALRTHGVPAIYKRIGAGNYSITLYADQRAKIIIKQVYDALCIWYDETKIWEVVE